MKKVEASEQKQVWPKKSTTFYGEKTNMQSKTMMGNNFKENDGSKLR
jgi:hypothetical protein